jgi:hypothetical protein
VTLVAPAIDRSKRRTAAEERRTHAALVARERARLVVEQRPRHGSSSAVARLRAEGRDAAARAALLADTRLHVERDVRARVAAGKLDGPIRDVRCRYRSGDAGPRVHVECLAVTSTLVRPKAPTVYVGHPFVVAASLRDGRYAWCKENPPAGEGFAGRGVAVRCRRHARDDVMCEWARTLTRTRRLVEPELTATLVVHVASRDADRPPVVRSRARGRA